MPQFPGSSGPVLIPGFRRPGSDDAFQFAADTLAPGVYAAYAFLNSDEIEYRNPQFLRALSGGVAVHVEEGSDQSISITDVIR